MTSIANSIILLICRGHDLDTICVMTEISIDKLYIPCISQRQSEEQGVEQSVPHVDQRVPVLTNIVVVDVDIVVVIIFHFCPKWSEIDV